MYAYHTHIYICMYIYIYIYTCNTNKHAPTHTHTHTPLRTHTHTHTRTHTQRDRDTQTNTHTHTHLCECILGEFRFAFGILGVFWSEGFATRVSPWSTEGGRRLNKLVHTLLATEVTSTHHLVAEVPRSRIGLSMLQIEETGAFGICLLRLGLMRCLDKWSCNVSEASYAVLNVRA